MVVNNASPRSHGRVPSPNVKQNAGGIVVVLNGASPRPDCGRRYEVGVKGIYGSGTPIPASATDVLEQIEATLK